MPPKNAATAESSGLSAPAAPVVSPKRHVPALDGVRGIAVLMVMLLHYEVRRWAWYGPVGHAVKYFVNFGWAGVDLFFVLSGFLITGILWDTREKPRYFVNFYARRTLRIFPLYYAFLLLIFVLLPVLAPGHALTAPTPFSTQIWYWAYASNILIALHGWNAAASYTPHFWSLAVEEQFYAVWPSVMRRVTRRGAIKLCLAVMIVAPLIRCWLLLIHGNAAADWVLTPARADSLAVGALIALMARGPRGLEAVMRHTGPLLILGVASVIGLLVWRGTYAPSDPGIGTVGYSVVALAWGTLLLAALSGGPVTKALSHPVLQWVGRRSYALYVLHYPILIALDRSGFTTDMLGRSLGSRLAAHAVFLTVNAGLAALAAEASWRLLESRMLALKKHFA